MAGQDGRTSPETVKRIVERKKAGGRTKRSRRVSGSQHAASADPHAGRVPAEQVRPKPKQTETKNHG